MQPTPPLDFRIFDPVLQGEKFGPDGGNVSRWVPELQTCDSRLIHRPWQSSHFAALLRMRYQLSITIGPGHVCTTSARLRERQAMPADAVTQVVEYNVTGKPPAMIEWG
jgi:hypothetical protein